MHPTLVLPALAAGLIFLPACEVDFGDFEKHESNFHFSYPLNANGRVSLETFNGSIEVSTWDQNTVDISGAKYGPSQEAADSLEINIDHSPDMVTIRAVRPSSTRGNRGARFVVKAPRGAMLDRLISSNGHIRTTGGAGPARFRTSNGAIQVRDLAGPLEAQTSNGSMELSNIDGDVQARTSNGRIRADGIRGSLEADSSNASITAELDGSSRPVRLETSNGSVDVAVGPKQSSDVRVRTNNSSITVRLPEDPHARILARTSNASIHSDFDLKMRGEISKHRVDAEVGGGGPLLDLTTSNGSIHLLR